MPAECSPTSMRFARLKERDVVADFGGGAMTSDAGALLLGATDRAIGLVDRFAGCFSDARAADRVVHDVATLVGQRVFGIALGYEDLLDHDELRHDPALGAVLGRLERRRSGCAPLAGKSTLNRLEHAPAGAHRYRRIGHDGAAIEALFVDLFLDAHERAPERLVLDLDATDDPLHGRQEGRFFHGYYDCYCYLPLYVFCGAHLLAAKLRRADIDASAGATDEVARIVERIRARWPDVEIVLRADSSFAREELMAWCEANRVDYLFGLARNARLAARLQPALDRAEAVREIQEILSSSGEAQSRPMEERRKPIGRIVQKDPFGSGIACVAMLAGKSYGAVAEEMFPDGAVPHTNTGDLKLALEAYGLEPAGHLVPFRSTKYQDLKDNAILKANPRRGGAEWHWVVWDAERRRLLDPREPPYKRIRACSYLRVR